MIERRISLRLIATTLVISGLVFAVGMLLGIQLTNSTNQSLRSELDALGNHANLLEFAALAQEAGSNQSLLFCPVYLDQLKLFDRQTENFRLKLDFITSKLGPNDPQVSSLASSYAYLQARDYLNLRRVNRECGNEFNVVLFFYSPNCLECQRQLESLAAVKKESKFSVLIYSFDATQEYAAIQALKAFYNASGQMPVTVFNERIIRGALAPQELRNYLYQAS